jgi:hypothetical protein
LQLKKITKENPSLLELPFLQEPIPEWMKTIEFKIDKFGTYQQLNMKSDLDVVRAMISGKLKNVLLKPSDNMGPDGLGERSRWKDLYCCYWNEILYFLQFRCTNQESTWDMFT